MCGRFTQSDTTLPGFEIAVLDEEIDGRASQVRYNGAPSQDFWVIRRHPETGEYTQDRLIWGLIPYWCKDPNGGRKPINARSETVASLASYRAACAKHRCIIPIDNFFDWRKTRPPKRPFAIGMADSSAFALAGIWENWKKPATGEYVRTFCILTCPANEMVAAIHDRMPVILPADAYHRWLSPIEPDPSGSLKPFPAELVRMWPISTRVNSPKNDDADLMTPLA